ncbi:MAG TPA: helix-turn-helix domain-containing protein [Pyrinomonadaceae bacterium]
MDHREEIAVMALDRRFSVTEVALRYGVSRPTVRLWRDRYREGGRSALNDLSHAPQSCPHRTSEEIETLIVAERERFGWGSKKILRHIRSWSYLAGVRSTRFCADTSWSVHAVGVIGRHLHSVDVMRPPSRPS